MDLNKLKQEAEELYEDWYAHKLGAISIIDVICKMAEPREKRISELEYQLTHRNCLDCFNHSSKLRMRTLELEKQLTNAKEIIKKYYKYNPSCEYFYEDIDKEAEQFLKENNTYERIQKAKYNYTD